MRQLILGVIIGAVLVGTLPVMAGKDIYKTTPQQQQYDYFRNRQQQLDISAMRRMEERRAAEQAIGLEPCRR